MTDPQLYIAKAETCLDRATESDSEEAAQHWLGEAQAWATLAAGAAVADAVDRMGREIVSRLEVGNRTR